MNHKLQLEAALATIRPTEYADDETVPSVPELRNQAYIEFGLACQEPIAIAFAPSDLGRFIGMFERQLKSHALDTITMHTKDHVRFTVCEYHFMHRDTEQICAKYVILDKYTRHHVP